MSRGASGRIVLEIDPDVKDELYLALAKSKLTLKDWFLMKCTEYLAESEQPSLFPGGEIRAKNKGEHRG